jgi:hypothetical protein
MVEVQVDHTTVVTAQHAAATCLLDQKTLDLLETARHGFSDAPLTSPTASPLPSAGIERKLSRAVPGASPDLHCARTVRGRRAAAPRDEWLRWRRPVRHAERMFADTPDGPLPTMYRRCAARGRGPKVGQQTFNLKVSVRFRAPPSIDRNKVEDAARCRQREVGSRAPASSEPRPRRPRAVTRHARRPRPPRRPRTAHPRSAVARSPTGRPGGASPGCGG